MAEIIEKTFCVAGQIIEKDEKNVSCSKLLFLNLYVSKMAESVCPRCACRSVEISSAIKN